MANLLHTLLDMVYPRTCAGCNIALKTTEQFVCIQCLPKLPLTGFFETAENPVKEIFYGRVEIAYAGSAFFYAKASMVQELLFALKYRHNKQAGIFMAGFLADALTKTAWIGEINTIIPLPLHPKKLRLRGYNQSAIIAKTIASLLSINVDEQAVSRRIFTETQTHKTREDRWRSMQNAFVVNDPEKLRGRHVLLVDDVITTGATLEACAAEILKVADVKLSIATLTYAI